MAGAEIVHRQSDAEFLDLLQDAGVVLRVLHQNRLGDFEAQLVAARGKARLHAGQRIGEVAQPARFEVHDQEGEVVEHVDAGDGLVELDAVEQRRPVVDEADIGKMQIAVAAADPSRVAARIEQSRIRRQGGARGIGQLIGFAHGP